MRNKDHHLLKRGRRYSIRYDIPSDLRDCYPSIVNRTVFEALGTSDKVEARKRRDHRLRELDQEWYGLRQAKKRNGSGNGEIIDASSWEDWATQVHRNGTDADEENLYYALSDHLDRLVEDTMRQRGIPLSDFEAHQRIAAEMKETRNGARLARARQIARGKATPISTVAEEWLRTKERLNSSSLSTYRKAFRVLQERFATVEEIGHREARNFLTDLLQELNKRTVKQYLIPYRGVWQHLGRSDAMWNVKGMDGPIRSVEPVPWQDEEYLQLLKRAEEKGFRDMWLAIRIAAHTGGAASGIASLRAIDDAEGRSLYLTETKREWRSRKIPCHPEIYDDVVEWENEHDYTAKSLSRKFGRLKDGLGFGREKVLHSFRHSAANKLENARLPSREIKRLLGHHIPDITFGTYNAQGLGYDVLFDVIKQIRWPPVE